MVSAKKYSILLLVALLCSPAFLCQGARAQTEPIYTLNQVAYHDETMVKPAMLNNQRYVFVSDGWASTQSPICIYSADSNWNEVSLLNETSAFSDFYVFTFPSLWNDTIVFCGSVGNGSAFIGSYNITSNTHNIVTTPNCSYITEVYYISSLNEFVLQPLSSGIWQGYELTCAANLSSLLNPSDWAVHGPFLSYGEMMFTYFQGSGWMISWNPSSDSQLIQWNMTNDAYSEPFNNTSGGLTQARMYISSNSTTMFFSTASGTTYQYYYTNDGVVFTSFLSLPAVISGQYGEQHASIYPLTSNYVLVGNIEDGDSAGYYALATTSGHIVENFTGVTYHYSENTPLTDGNNFVLGGEGVGYDVMGLRGSMYLNILASTIDKTTETTASPSPSPSPTSVPTSNPSPTPTPTSAPSVAPVINESKANTSSVNTPFQAINLAATIAVFSIIVTLAVYMVRRRRNEKEKSNLNCVYLSDFVFYFSSCCSTCKSNNKHILHTIWNPKC